MKTSNFELVGQFMKACDQTCLDKPQFPAEEVIDLREYLIEEELTEFQTANEEFNIVEVADALADLLYVVYGAGHAYGIDLDKVFQEVHRSNMTKLVNGVAVKNAMGKIQKPPTYDPPNIKKVLGVE